MHLPSDLPPVVLSPNAEIVLTKRYLRKGLDGQPIETPTEMFWRVALAIAQVEARYPASPWSVDELARTFYRLMVERDFLPNSPTLMNAGTELGQLAACFVLPVGDSMEEIFDAVKHAALIHKSGGGTGFSFSRLRPRNSRVGSTGGIASGPISFLKIFNTATEQVKQGGTRRGANMGILRVDHPDILDFIRAKERDGELNNFNLSVALTEAFMEAVAKDEDYPLVAPHTGATVRTLKAREVFDLLVRKAWESGDPGIIFLDRINRDNPTPDQGEIESTNPCVTGDTWVMTDAGPRQVADLVATPAAMVVHGHAVPTQGFFATGTKPVYRLRTREGYWLRLTADHRVLCQDETGQRRFVPAQDITPGTTVVLAPHARAWPGPLSEAEGYLVGLVVGDGTIKADKAVLSVWTVQAASGAENPPPNGVMAAALAAARTLPARADFTGWIPVEGRNEWRMSLASLTAICRDLGLAPGRKTVTPAMETCSSDFYRGFLRGLFDADGSVQGTQAKGVSIRLAQSDLGLLEAVQRMLLRLGIASTIYRQRRPAGMHVLPDGRGGSRPYPVQDQHELVITGDNIVRFQDTIGFCDDAKQARLRNVLAEYRRRPNAERFLATVEAMVPDGQEPVFDIHVPGYHVFDANGIMVHNCGEQPLLPYEACNLGSINLARFVCAVPADRPVDRVDWHRLRETVHLAVRFLDNVIDASQYPLPRITETVQRNRKIGLGVMGWADMLYQLRIPYDSPEALSLAEEVMGFVQRESKAASAALAAERGPFPAYATSVYPARGEGPYRNATTTTIAPTGTLSILAGCSSGIEPLFALAFVRQVLDGEKLREVNPYVLDALREAGLDRDDVLEHITTRGSVRDLEEVPEAIRRVFVTAMDIAPVWHLTMQAAFQRHTDNAVSKTVNLPSTATEDDIRAIYWMAYEEGCKGVTVYRDGCKASQVLCTGDGPKKDGPPAVFGECKPMERPEIVRGFTQKVKTGLGDLYLTVNEIDGRPFEVFATIGRSGRSITAKAEAIGRLVSLALRSGIHVREIVKQLKGIGGEHPVFQKKGMLLSIPDAVAWVLAQHYLRDETVPASATSLVKPVCPDCGRELTFQEGCFLCAACGFTRCG